MKISTNIFPRSSFPLYSNDKITNEQRLWQAVVLNALCDAMRDPKNKYTKNNKITAISWLMEDNNNFIRVCEYAGINPSSLRRKLHQFFIKLNQSNPKNLEN